MTTQEEQRAKQRAYYQKNKQRLLARRAERRKTAEYKEKQAEYNREYNERTKERQAAYQRAYYQRTKHGRSNSNPNDDAPNTYIPDTYTYIVRIPGLDTAFITSNDLRELVKAVRAHLSELVYSGVLTRDLASGISATATHVIQGIATRDIEPRSNAGKTPVQSSTTIRLPANTLKTWTIEEQLARTRELARQSRNRRALEKLAEQRNDVEPEVVASEPVERKGPTKKRSKEYNRAVYLRRLAREGKSPHVPMTEEEMKKNRSRLQQEYMKRKKAKLLGSEENSTIINTAADQSAAGTTP